MFPKHVEDQAKHHAMYCYPHESCGFVVKDDDGQFVYIPKPNLSNDPENEFIIAPEEFIAFEPVAIVHSHPDTQKLEPSHGDIQGSIDTDCTWGVFTIRQTADKWHISEVVWWGKDVPKPPLIGREFRSGPSGSDGKGDCYALCKDYYEAQGIIIPEFARSSDWWEHDGNLYVENFEKAGFKQISIDEIRNGDAFIAKIRSKVPNHAGIYLDNTTDGKGLILHHLMFRLSRREPATIFRHTFTHIIRYEG